MMLIEETAVPQASLPLDEFKAHLRLGTGFSDGDIQDPVLESFLRAALAAIEARTGKILISRSFSWVISSWRKPDGQPLPVAPIETITRLSLVHPTAGTSVVDAGSYVLRKDDHRPVLEPLGALLPGVPSGGTVEIDFSAGMAADWSGLPADLGHAVLILAAHYYEYRHDTGLKDGALPFGVASLIERYRNVRVLAGGQS